jgi:hypothetical protein
MSSSYSPNEFPECEPAANFSTHITGVPEVYTMVSIVLFVFGVTHVVVSFTLFWIFRHTYPRLECRSYIVVFAISIATLSHNIAELVFLQNVLPCAVGYIAVILIVPTSGLSLFGRIFDFLNKQVFGRIVANISLDKLLRADDDDDETVKGSVVADAENNAKEISTEEDMVRGELASAKVAHVSGVASVGGDGSKMWEARISLHNNDESLTVEKTPSTVGKEKRPNAVRIASNHNTSFLVINRIFGVLLRILKTLASTRARVIFIILIAIPYELISIFQLSTVPMLEPSNNCYGCDITVVERVTITITGAVLVLVVAVAAYFVRNFKDHYGKKQEIQLTMCSSGMSLVVFTVQTVIGGDAIYYHICDYSLWTCFQLSQFFTVTLQVILAIQNSKLADTRERFATEVGWVGGNKREKTKSKKIASESNAIVVAPDNAIADTGALDRFNETLKSSTARSEFEDFLIHEFAVENLRMYDECENWRLTFFDSTAVTRRSRAKRIYLLFVEPNSVFYGEFILFIHYFLTTINLNLGIVNLPSKARDDLQQKIMVDAKGALNDDLFAVAQKEMFNIMLGAHSRHLKRRFLKN